MTRYAIETEGLCKRFRHLEAVHSLNLQIPHGEVFGLLGPNGAGKTTSILMLLGNIRPSGGKGMLLEKPLGDIGVKRKVGFLPEKFQFHDFLTAEEFLEFHGRLAGMNSKERALRIPQVLEQVGLADRAKSRIREFSKGMQQRIGLAQAMLHRPEIIILDEPTSALDPLGRRHVRDIIQNLHEQGCTVLLNSHLLSEIEMTCNRVAIMKRGEVVTQGRLGDLLAFSSVVEMEVEGLNDAALQALRQVATKLKFESLPPRKITAWVASEDAIPELARAVVCNGAKLLALIPKRETLEDMFLRVIGESYAASTPTSSEM